ncbi:MAG: prephenate dehydrogenase/arogenate dehydrogenase family protein [Nitrospinae bacterium]|nr:prephenate dehydrogenase/arogenate dehydrogenase family protein [Nitrospinota bacterium]
MTIIGVGLIGGSLARVCKEKNLIGRITGFGRNESNLKKGVELGVIDSYTLDLKEAVRNVDIVLLATPVGVMVDIVKIMIPHLKEGTIITDVGSVKGYLVDKIEELLPKGIPFVGGHPIAGSERSGVESSLPTLFKNYNCILTPTEKTDREALKKIEELWYSAGAKVILMDAKDHDRILAAISHLPHVVAYALVNTIGDICKEEDNLLSLAAGGFKDFTRIASSDSVMWCDICLLNRDNILEIITQFKGALERLRRYIKEENGTRLKEEFNKANSIRNLIC